MMKKNGFTLAEVLITLAIIGVVATMTLPALMTNTAEQQAKTGIKKGINTLTEAAQMNNAVAGFDYASISEESANGVTENQSLFGLLANRTALDLEKSKVGGGTGAATNFTVFFRDGATLSFVPGTLSNNTTAAEMQTDNLPYGIAALYDTNGLKSPNIISNCNGELTGATSDTGDCSNKQNRVVRDQFGVRLRGNIAVPNGAAARWAYEN